MKSLFKRTSLILAMVIFFSNLTGYGTYIARGEYEESEIIVDETSEPEVETVEPEGTSVEEAEASEPEGTGVEEVEAVEPEVTGVEEVEASEPEETGAEEVEVVEPEVTGVEEVEAAEPEVTGVEEVEAVESEVTGVEEIDELDKGLDDIISQLQDIEIFVPQELRDRLADIVTGINNINDWSSKEPLVNKQAAIEEDINIKDQIGYIKGQIDDYTQNPNEAVKGQVIDEIKVLRDRIKNQKLSENASNNDYQLDLLEGILTSKPDKDIGEDIKNLLEKIRSDLAGRNGDPATGETRSDVVKVKDLISSLAESNPSRSEFSQDLGLLEEDISIKDELEDLGGIIKEYLDNNTNDLKDKIKDRTSYIRGEILKEELEPHKTQNMDKLEGLIKLYKDKDQEGEKNTEDRIRQLLDDINKDLIALNGYPSSQTTRDKYQELEGLIDSLKDTNNNKAGFVEEKRKLGEDIRIKDSLASLDEMVEDYLKNPSQGLKDELLAFGDRIRGDIRSENLEPEKTHNRTRWEEILKKVGDKDKDKENEKEDKIKKLIEKIRKDLEDLRGSNPGDGILNDYQELLNLIGSLDSKNPNKPSYYKSSGDLSEDIDLKVRIDKLNGLVGSYEDLTSPSKDLRDEILGEYYKLRGGIEKEVLSPHKNHNMEKLQALKERIENKDKEFLTSETSQIEKDLDKLRQDLEGLKGARSTEAMNAFEKDIRSRIEALDNKNLKKPDLTKRIDDLREDILIKEAIYQVEKEVENYKLVDKEKKKDLKNDIESKISSLRIRIYKEVLEPHKTDNMNKLKAISDDFNKIIEGETSSVDDEISRLIEKIRKELEDLNGGKAGKEIKEELENLRGMIEDLDRDNKNKTYYEEKLSDLIEDIGIKDDLAILEEEVASFNRGEEALKTEISSRIDNLSKRISNQVLTPHDIHNKNKLMGLRDEFNSLVSSDDEANISKLLEDLRKDLENLNGGNVTNSIREKYDRLKDLILKLENKDKFIKDLSDLEEDIKVKDRLEDLEAGIDAYINSEDNIGKDQLMEEMEEVAGTILDQNLVPHKNQNMARLNNLYEKYKNKNKGEEDKKEDRIKTLIEKLIRDLEELNGGLPGDGIRSDYEELNRLISSLDPTNINKPGYKKDLGNIEEDISIKDNIANIGTRIDGYKLKPSEEEKLAILDEISRLKGWIRRELLSPHKDQNLEKLSGLENILKDFAGGEADLEDMIKNLISKIKKDLEDKKGDKADEPTRKDLKDLDSLISKLDRSNKNKSSYILSYNQLKKDIEIKDQVDGIDLRVKEYIKDYDPSLKDDIYKELVRLKGVIGGEDLTPHKTHNMDKLNRIYRDFLGKNDGNLSQDEENIEKLLKEIRKDLEDKKGYPIESSTGKKLGRVKDLINKLPETSKKKPEFNLDYSYFYDDAVIKNQVEIIAKAIEEYKNKPSDDLKKDILETSGRIKERIRKEPLVPHKDHNIARLNKLMDKFNDLISGVSHKNISDLLDKIKEDLRLVDGNPAKDETRKDLESAKTLISILSSEDKDKLGFKERFELLSKDVELKDRIRDIGLRIKGLTKENISKLKDGIKNDILALKEEISREDLTPHKKQNMNRLLSLEEELIKKEKDLMGNSSEDRIAYLISKIRLELEKLKGEPAGKPIRNEMLELEGLIKGLDKGNKNKEAYERSFNTLKKDIEIKDTIEKWEEEVKLIVIPDDYLDSSKQGEEEFERRVGEKLKELNQVKVHLRESEGTIKKESLYPHSKHNEDKLLRINSGLVYKKIEFISLALDKLDGNPANSEIKASVNEIKEEIKNLEIPEDEKEYEIEREELYKDIGIKDDLASLEGYVRKLSNKSSTKDKDKARDEIRRLERLINKQKLNPHKQDNMKKLSRIEDLFRDNISSSSSSSISSSGSSHRDKDKNKDKDKDYINDLLDDINKDLNDKEDGKDVDLDRLEDDIDYANKKVNDLNDKDYRDEFRKEIARLKNRLNALKAKDSPIHKPYITGYSDGSIRPEKTATREEVATVIYKILGEDSLAKYKTNSHSFKDIPSDSWSRTYIATLTNAGILTGYKDGNFMPKKEITRGELAGIIARVKEVPESKVNRFNDTSGYWAEGYINGISQKGWINGYSDGSFRPRKNITRAELVTMINAMLGRNRKLEKNIKDLKLFNDLDPKKWYYEDIVEATVDHRP